MAKIVSGSITQISIPLEAPLRWAFGLRTHITRNIVRLQLDNGVEGIGETVGGEVVKGLLAGVIQSVRGESVFALERMAQKLKMHSYFSGYAGLASVCGVEMACWDAMGKTIGRPVYDLMGGAWARELDFAGYLFYRYPSEDGRTGGEATPEQILRQAQDIVGKHGFKALNLKGGVYPPAEEIAALKTLRAHFGPDMGLRIDAQANWKYETAIKWWPELRELRMDFLEDPVWGLDSMARLRREIQVPFASNMWICDFETLQAAIRLMPVDIVLADPHRWGGLLACKKLCAVAEVMNLTIALHSAAELGISTAACLHLAASSPAMRSAMHTHYPYQPDDIIKQSFVFAEGKLRVPVGPGLGVELDEDKVRQYEDVYKTQATTGAPAHVRDMIRPDHVPQAY